MFLKTNPSKSYKKAHNEQQVRLELTHYETSLGLFGKKKPIFTFNIQFC